MALRTPLRPHGMHTTTHRVLMSIFALSPFPTTFPSLCISPYITYTHNCF